MTDRDQDVTDRDRDPGSDSDIPANGETVPDMLSSDQIFQRIVADADHEIT